MKLYTDKPLGLDYPLKPNINNKIILDTLNIV